LVPLAIFALARGTGPLSGIAKTRPQDAYNLFNSFVGKGRLLLLAYFVPCSIGFLCALKALVQWKELSKTWSYAFLLSWLFVPLVIGIVISLWQPVLRDRYFIICLPPLVLLVAVGLSQVRPSWISVVSLIVLLALSARADFRYYSHPHKADCRGATAYVVSHALPKDGMLFYPGSARFEFDYYVRRLNPEAQTWQIVFPEPYDWMRGEAMWQPSDSMVRTIPKGYERVWLVLWRIKPNDLKYLEPIRQIQTILQANFPHTREQEFPGVKLVLYQQK